MSIAGILILLTCIVAGVVAGVVTKNPNNPVEVMAESVIEKEIGAPSGSIHLTPQESSHN